MINLTGPTAAITTGALSAATYTFTADLSTDPKARAFAVTAVGGTQAGVSTSTIDKPKQFIVKRAENFKIPSGYNAISGRYARVPKNVTKVIGRGAAAVAASQIESLPMVLEIGVPAGAQSYDEANVRACIAFYIAALWDQKEEIIQACIDGMY